jgi:hypothetical protein
MSKWFLTDELNDMYTVQVTNAKKAKIETGAGLFKILSSAASTVNASAQTVASAPCYLKSIIIGQIPATATQVSLYNSAPTSTTNMSAFGSSGDNIIARLQIDTSAGVCAAAATYPRVIPIDVYCSSGLVAAIGEGQTYAALSGCAKGVTIIYQT